MRENERWRRGKKRRKMIGKKIIFQDRVTIGWVGCGCDSSARKLLEEEMCKLQSGDSILVGFKGI